MFCIQCGSKTEPHANFCWSCSARVLNRPTDRAENAPKATSASSRTSEDVSGRRECPRCRLWNPGGAERCDCGYRFGAGTGTTMASPSARTVKKRRLNNKRWYYSAWGTLSVFLGVAVLVSAGHVSSSGYSLWGSRLASCPRWNASRFPTRLKRLSVSSSSRCLIRT